MSEDRLQGASSGSGFRPSDHAAVRHGRPGFNPSRMALLPIDDNARSFNDSALPSVMIWAGGDAYEDLVERNALPAEDSRSLDLDPWAIAVGVYRAMTEAASRAICARDERRDGRDDDGRDDDGRLGAKHASAVANGEAPDAIDKLKKENAELRREMRQMLEELVECNDTVSVSTRLRARTLLSQSSEGE